MARLRISLASFGEHANVLAWFRPMCFALVDGNTTTQLKGRFRPWPEMDQR